MAKEVKRMKPDIPTKLHVVEKILDNGKRIRYESFNGQWSKAEYDLDGNLLNYENSVGYWERRIYKRGLLIGVWSSHNNEKLDWTGITLPMVRKVFSSTSTLSKKSVEPMPIGSSPIFYLNFANTGLK